MRAPIEAVTQPKRKESPMQRLPLRKRPFGSRLYFAAVLAAAFLLVPAAQAFANAETGIITGAGEGSGTVGGESFGGGSGEAGIPPVECHWNGEEGKWDIGTRPEPPESGVPGLDKCATEIQTSGFGNIYLGAHKDPGVQIRRLDGHRGFRNRRLREPRLLQRDQVRPGARSRSHLRMRSRSRPALSAPGRRPFPCDRHRSRRRRRPGQLRSQRQPDARRTLRRRIRRRRPAEADPRSRRGL